MGKLEEFFDFEEWYCGDCKESSCPLRLDTRDPFYPIYIELVYQIHKCLIFDGQGDIYEGYSEGEIH